MFTMCLISLSLFPQISLLELLVLIRLSYIGMFYFYVCFCLIEKSNSKIKSGEKKHGCVRPSGVPR